MALPPIVVPPFPNVPRVPGVPDILRSISFPTPDPVAIFRDNLGLSSAEALPVWGVFDAEGAPLLVVDSVVDVEYRKDADISTFPVEEGSFESYNKVAIPVDLRLSVTKSGTLAEREGFLAACERLAASIELCTVVTDVRAYPSLNCTHVDYSRKRDKGFQLITVSLSFMEVRVTATATYVDTKEPNGADPVNEGPVRPAEPTTAQASAIGPKL